VRLSSENCPALLSIIVNSLSRVSRSITENTVFGRWGSRPPPLRESVWGTFRGRSVLRGQTRKRLQVEFSGSLDRLIPAVDIEFSIDALEMRTHGAGCDIEFPRDFRHRQPALEQAQDCLLPVGQ
jgi:hypothetical protein